MSERLAQLIVTPKSLEGGVAVHSEVWANGSNNRWIEIAGEGCSIDSEYSANCSYDFILQLAKSNDSVSSGSSSTNADIANALQIHEQIVHGNFDINEETFSHLEKIALSGTDLHVRLTFVIASPKVPQPYSGEKFEIVGMLLNFSNVA